MARLVFPHIQAELCAIGLDTDGVLRPTGLNGYNAVCRAIAEFGGTPPDVHTFVRDYHRGSQRGFYQKWGAPKGIHRRQLHKAFKRHLVDENAPPCNDVERFLSHLESLNIRLFVVSGYRQEALQAWFRKHELEHRFVIIRGSGKDKIDALREVHKSLGVDARQTAYVGDYGLDMRAAKEVGAIPIGITRENRTHGALLESGAMYVVNHLHELCEFIKA